MSISRNICASGWRPGRRPRAASSSKWMSIPRASCSLESEKACRHLRRQAFLCAGNPATVTQRNAYTTKGFGTPSGNDLGGDATDAGAGQADGAGRAGGEVEHAAADERATVIDGHDDAAAAMGHTQLGTKRQRAVGAGHGAGIHALTRGGPAAGLITVVGGYARKGAACG